MATADNQLINPFAQLTRMPGMRQLLILIGLAASMSLNASVAPFILRGASLLGIDSGYTAMPLRRKVWERLAGDMRPAHLAGMTRTVKLSDLPPVFDEFIKGQAHGRVVVDCAG